MRFNILHTFRSFLERSLNPKLGFSLSDINPVNAGIGLFTGGPAGFAASIGSDILSGGTSDIAAAQAAGSAFNPVDLTTSVGTTSFYSPEEVAAARAALEAGTTPGTEAASYYDDHLDEWVTTQGTAGTSLSPEERARL